MELTMLLSKSFLNCIQETVVYIQIKTFQIKQIFAFLCDDKKVLLIGINFLVNLLFFLIKKIFGWFEETYILIKKNHFCCKIYFS